MALKQCCVLIPAYQPTSQLITVCRGLMDRGLTELLIINDGSSATCAPIFDELRLMGCQVLDHASNQGKGAALKTGFTHCLAAGYAALVTADADGQHLPLDIERVAHKVLEQTEPAAVLGVRHFSGDVPLRSALGNKMTRGLFAMLSGLHVTDTQTGLRAFTASLLPELLELQGRKYEYEMNVLLHLARNRPILVEVPIQTVYLDGNAGSHFRPVMDSVRIYGSLLRDLVLALSSFGLDIALFSVLYATGWGVLPSTYGARVVSGVYNFVGSKFFVFKEHSMKRLRREAIQYVLLALFISTASGMVVEGLLKFSAWDPVVCKLLTDLVLYSVSYLVRRWLIFRPV